MKCSSFILTIILGCSSLAAAGDGSACDKLFSFAAHATPQTSWDTSDHLSTGRHGITFAPVGLCDYSNSSGHCYVKATANPSTSVADYGLVKRTGYRHSGEWGGTYGSANGSSPQTATTNYIGGVVACLGGCGDETVLGGPPWTISPDPWLYAVQGSWPNQCPSADAGDQGCIIVQDKTDHGFKCCPPENCTSPIAIGAVDQDWSNVFGGPCVWFRMYGSKSPKVCVDWTASGSGVGWLAKPSRNQKGQLGIWSIGDLFGSMSPQGATRTRIADGQTVANGYFALGVYDKNLDWAIDSQDPAYGDLCKWVDDNPRNGKLDPGECHPLSEVGVHSLSLKADNVKLADKRGNQGRLSAVINNDPKWQSVDWYVQVRKR